MSSAQVKDVDVVVIGAGMIGAICACLLARANPSLMIALIESRPYQDLRGGDFDPRVSAITERTRRLLDGCGLWDAIARERICGYTKMEVWDAEGTGRVRFNCDDLGASNLGHIVENCVLQGAAIDALDDYDNLILYCPEIVQSIAPALADGSTVVQLGSGQALCTRLLIGADGAASQVRRATGLATREWDYRQSAIVACVETEKAHLDTAWQSFMPTGPMALLPLPSDREAHFCSLVWSQDSAVAEALMALDDDQFCRQLGVASEHCLGQVLAVKPRFLVPLRQRHALDYIAPGVALVGDAAHSIHPLAGQGVNLGFADIQVLVEEISRAQRRGCDIGALATLKRFQRRRKADNLSMMVAMEFFQRLFASPQLTVRALRNAGMRQFDRSPGLKQSIIRRAMGL